MAVDDHGLEAIRKAAEEVTEGDKSDYYIKTQVINSNTDQVVCKLLAQVEIATGTAATVYTVPVNTQVKIERINVINTGVNNTDFFLYLDQDGTTYNNTTLFYEAVHTTSDQVVELHNSPVACLDGGTIGALATNSGLILNIFGTETTAGPLVPGDNPNEVTFTQAVDQDSLVTPTGAQAREVLNGGNADSLHNHTASSITDFNSAVAGTPAVSANTFGVANNNANIIFLNNAFTDVANTFEAVSKNIRTGNYVLNYTGGILTSIDYTIGSDSITKTFNYTAGVLTSIVLSGDLPSGTQTTKTLTYTGSDLTGVTYS